MEGNGVRVITFTPKHVGFYKANVTVGKDRLSTPLEVEVFHIASMCGRR